MKNKAVFLDKDGTLIPDIPFNVDPAKIELYEGAERGLRVLQQLGFVFIVVSNQSGVARGYFPAQALEAVQLRLKDLFQKCDLVLTACYFCPHSPDGVVDPYVRECDCRKPKPGLLIKAADEWNIDLSSSWMLGDILNDIEAGKRAGCKTILIDNGGETEWLTNAWRQPDLIAPDLYKAAILIAEALKTENADDETRMAAL